MNALSQLPTDATTPLGSPDVLNWFDAYVDGHCTLRDLRRALLDICSAEPSAAHHAILLIHHHAESGKLRLRDFRELLAELERLASIDPNPLTTEFASSVTTELEFPLLSQPRTEVSLPYTTELASEAPDRSEPRFSETAHELDPTRAHIVAFPEDDYQEPSFAGDESQTPAQTSEEPADASGDREGPIVLRGRYVLQQQLGAGGMGTIYRALDRNRAGLPHRDQYVALKILRDEYAKRPEALHALRREFHLAQSLSHPGIVNVFDFDNDGETHFVTMELLDGEPLGALMQRVRPHKLALEPATTILRELGEAVAYAHEQGVLHMDLKPGNVLVTREGHVRVLDFGLAQTFLPEPWISSAGSSFDAATPAYASCERLIGDLPDVRDDIYSYSCLAYELLSGRHPFERRSALEARNEGRKPRRIASLSRSQWRTLKSGLAWSRDARPDSMAQLLAGLDLAVIPQRRARGFGMQAPARRTPWASLLASLLVIAIIAGGYVAWTRMPDESRAALVGQAGAAQQTLLNWVDDTRIWASAQLAALTDRIEPAAPTPAATTPAATSEQMRPAEAVSTAPVVASESAPAVDPGGEAPAAAADLGEGPVMEPLGLPPMADTDTGSPPPVSDAPVPTALPVESSVSPAPVPTPVAPEPAAKPSGGPGVLEMVEATYPTSESASTARVTVRRRSGSAGEIAFVWQTRDDSATAGEDYAAQSPVVEVMRPGQTSTTLLVPLVADGVAEHTELFDVEIVEALRGATLGQNVRVPVIVVDDD
jgi:serine/threonine protein kinase